MVDAIKRLICNVIGWAISHPEVEAGIESWIKAKVATAVAEATAKRP